jgi:hypothetical protein
MFCELPKEPTDPLEATPVPHVGHFHIVYQPYHKQYPFKLAGQTVLRVGRIKNFTL